MARGRTVKTTTPARGVPLGESRDGDPPEVGHHGVPYDDLPLLLGLGVVKGPKI